MAKQDFINWVERQGQILRTKLALTPTATLDPYKLASVMGVAVISPHDIVGFSITSIEKLLGTASDGWSAGSLRTPDGRAYVVMNTSHPLTRRHATLMEELSHIHLNHKPSKLIVTEVGVAMRDYQKSKETEAYWVGSAALVPRIVLLSAQREGVNRRRVASTYVVSEDLVRMRENVTGIRLH